MNDLDQPLSPAGSSEADTRLSGFRPCEPDEAADPLQGGGHLERCVTGAISLCKVAAQADLWMLVRCADGAVTTLAAAPQHPGNAAWPDAGDFLSRARRVAHLPDASWRDALPEGLRSFRSLISAPLALPGGSSLALLLLAQRDAAFSEHDHELLQATAHMVHKALQHACDDLTDIGLARALGGGPAAPRAPEGAPDASIRARPLESAQLARWQGAIVRITNELLSAHPAESDAAINRALAQTGALASSDRTYVFRLRGSDRIDNTHEWTAGGIEPMIEHLQDMPASLMDEWRPDMAAGRAVHIPDVAALPRTSSVRDVLLMQGIRSLLAVPMLRDAEIVGFVGFDAVRSFRRFAPHEIQLLQAVANSVNIVLDRCAAETAAETARAHLEAERNRLHSTLTAIPDLVLELDGEGRFSSHVAGAAPLLAVPSDDLTGRMPEDVLPPELAALARRVMRIVDREGRVTAQEYELSVEGVTGWYSLSAAARHKEGVPCGYVFVIRDITPQLVQRQRLRRLGKIAELTSNLVIVTDAEHRVEWVNPAFERRTGWRLDEITGKRPDSFLASAKTDQAELRRIGAALHNGEQVRAEVLNQTRDGEEYWVSKDIQPLFGAEGQIEGFIAVQTDITEMKRSHQKALRDRAAALDASGDGIAITDASGHYTYMNAAHRRMFGIGKHEDVSGLSWRDLLPADRAATFIADHWEDFAATGTWRGEIDGLHRTGTRVPQEVSLTLRDNGILCIARDISDRRRLEQALYDRAAALDASDDGIAITDASGHYTYMNAAHRRMFGIRDDEDITTLHWNAIYPEETIKRFMSREWHELQTTGRWRGELHGVHRDGSPVPQEVSLTSHRDGILCLTRDISEKVQRAAEDARLREELQLAQRRETIAHVASGLAHDLNNLVAVVVGATSMLRSKVADDETAAASIERIRRAAQAASDLVSGLGQLGRPRAARAIHDLRDLIAVGVELLGTRRVRDHELDTCLPDTPCPVWGNQTELLQVIVNLALNACEASDELPNRVSLAVCDQTAIPDRAPDAGRAPGSGDYSVFAIRDSGTGIDADVRARLFDKYFTTKSETGTGLGLPIVAAILRDNGAALWLDSAPGAGTRVTVAWPARQSQGSDVAPGTQAPDATEMDLNGRNVLVVDDLLDVAEVLAEFLEASGANAVAVADPEEAAALLRDNPGTWAALVTDLEMPTLSGRELARVAADCAPAVPVIVVTARPESLDRDTVPFRCLLAKPVQPDRLVAAVQDAISQAEASRSAENAATLR